MSNSIRDKFSDEEWFLVSSAPSLIGASMAKAGKSGFLGTIKEAMANMKSLMSGKNEYPDNELIGCILQGAENFSEAKEKASLYREKLMADIKNKNIKTNGEFQNYMLENCGKAMKLIKANCSATEASQYGQWVKSVAQKVAESASEGGFLGFGGEQVSENEKVLLTKIEGMLKTSTNA